jgi:hypothetical protein
LYPENWQKNKRSTQCKIPALYATRDPETVKHKYGKEETKETAKLIARGEKDSNLVIKNSQTSTI